MGAGVRTSYWVDGLVLGVLITGLAVASGVAVFEREQVLAAGQRAPFCGPGEAPGFAFGFAALAEQLGGRMGQPQECEHPDLASGDVLQKTTTGVAVYRWCTNTPTFTMGAEHWALVPDGLAHWSEPSADPTAELPQVQPSSLRRPCPAPR